MIEDLKAVLSKAYTVVRYHLSTCSGFIVAFMGDLLPLQMRKVERIGTTIAYQ